MPTFIGMVLGAAIKPIGMGARLAGAGTVGKMVLGAGVGGIYGATQGYDINSAIEGAGKGMALGALGGAAVGLGPGMLFGGRRAISAQAGITATNRARMLELGAGVAGPVTKQVYQESLWGQQATRIAREMKLGKGVAGPVTREAYKTGFKKASHKSGLVQLAAPMIVQGGKTLWSTNLKMGAGKSLKAERLRELGPGGIGPLTKKGWKRATSVTGRLAGSPLIRAPKFALNHPFLTAGAAVGTMGVTQGWGLSRIGRAQAGYSPTLEGAKMNVTYNQQALAAAELGQIGGGMIGPPGDMQGRFEQANWMNTVGKSSGGRLGSFRNSTVGLTQGLHAGRHG